jgi:hypothetical protein
MAAPRAVLLGTGARRGGTIVAGALAVAAVLAAGGGGAAIALGTGPVGSARPTSPRRASPPGSPGTRARGPSSAHGGPTTASPSSTTTQTTSAGSPGGPWLTSVTPGAGAAGQSVAIAGSGLFSSDGVITASFNGSAAAVGCPSQTACTVTVPDLGTGPVTVILTITTSGGNSNGVPFSYQ